MNKITAGIRDALATIKSLPTVFRVPDQQFANNGGRVNRILGGANGESQQNPEVYTSSVWVYTAVNAISRNIAGVPFVFQREEGNLRTETPLTRLFEKPNELQGYGQFMDSLISWWHVNGEVVLFLDRENDRELPKEMWALDSTQWKQKYNDNGTLAGWVFFNKQGIEVPFRKHNVIFIKFWNPTSLDRGLSPISAAAAGIQQDHLANTFNSNFFANSGAPSGVIEIEQNLTDPEFERVVKQYEDNHGGPQKAHKMLILEGGAKFKPTVFTQKDMEFLNQKKWNRDATLAAFGVPKMEVGIIEEGANLAVIKMQSREFWLKNLIPKMSLISWHLWAELFSKLNGGRVWAEFDTSAIDALQDEFHEKVKTARSMWEMSYTMNQINKRLGLGMPENTWQNTAYHPLQVAPVAVDADGTPIVQDTTDPGKDPLQPPSTGIDTEPNDGTPVVAPAREVSPDDKPRAAVAESNKELIGLLTKKLERFYFKQRVRQLKSFGNCNTAILECNIEESTLKSYLEDRDVDIDCIGLQRAVHKNLLIVTLQHYESNDILIAETKQFYNNLNKTLPMVAEKLVNG